MTKFGADVAVEAERFNLMIGPVPQTDRVIKYGNDERRV
jgi:hypothetical protein